MLNILLNKPEEHALPEKPSAIRTGKIFTLNLKIISIGSMKADDNGPYIGKISKLYYYDEIDGAFVVHKYDDMLYYYNKRIGCRYPKEFVSPEKIYDLTRRYCQSKYNPWFNNRIVMATSLTTNITCDYYLVIYKWSQPPTVEFIMPRHGNASTR